VFEVGLGVNELLMFIVPPCWILVHSSRRH
jgi:hypothetical protein